MRSAAILLCVASTACGGPFTSAIDPPDAHEAHEGGRAHRDSAAEAHAEAGRLDAADSGHPTDAANVPDDISDAPQEVEAASGLDGSTDGDPPDVGAPDACTPVPATTSWCGGLTYPTSFCGVTSMGSAFQAPTPPECLCDYTCACILAHASSYGNPCGSGTTYCNLGGPDSLPEVECGT